MSNNSSSNTRTSATIVGVFTVIAACVTGAFLLINTLIEQGFVVIGPGVQVGNPQIEETVVPATQVSPQSSIISLKYDETDETPFERGQTQFVAVYLREVQAGDSLEEAIQSIKQQTANAHATIQEGKSINIQLYQAYLVWCPNADCTYPTITEFPLEGFRQDYSKVALVKVGESRMVQCPSDCWAVAVR